METTQTGIVTQLINQARSQVGDLERIGVPHVLFEAVYAEVVDAGGDAGFEHCMVDGVRVVAQDDDTPVAVPRDGGEPVPLSG